MTSKFSICWSGNQQFHYFCKYSLCLFLSHLLLGLHSVYFCIRGNIPEVLEILFIFFFNSFFLLFSNWVVSGEVSSDLLALLPFRVRYWALWWLCPFSHYVFQLQNLCLVSFLFMMSVSLLKFIIFWDIVPVLEFFRCGFLSFFEHIYDTLFKVFV